MELWTHAFSAPRAIRRSAQLAEQGGWDGLSVVDSQNLSGDPFIALAQAANVTETLKLQTGVSNSITRNPAALATAIATVQSISRGRAVLGIGRGDSALAHLGRAPAKLRQFERYLRHLETYLSGGHVPFEEIEDISLDAAPPISELELAHAPHDSHIRWIEETQGGDRKVPVEVAASGPKVIAIAARTAERVVFTVGASPARLQWGIDLARDACRAAGNDPSRLKFGAYINCGCHPELDTARELVRGGLTVYARFGIMHGKSSGPLTESQRTVLDTLRTTYNMNQHTRGDSDQAGVLTPEFIDEYAIVGKPGHVIDRLRELQAMGIGKVILSGTRSGVDDATEEARGLLESDVLPAFRGAP